MAIADELKKAVNNSEMTRYRIAIESGVEQSTLSRLMHGKVSDVRVNTIERVAEALGYEVRLAKRRIKGKGR